MKTIKTHLRVIAFFFSTAILFQGCTVYKSANVTLEEAAKSETKIIVKENNSKAIMFNRIEVEDGKYFGVKKVKGELLNFALNEDNLSRISLKDKTLSTVLSIAIPLVIIGIFIALTYEDISINE